MVAFGAMPRSAVKFREGVMARRARAVDPRSADPPVWLAMDVVQA